MLAAGGPQLPHLPGGPPRGGGGAPAPPPRPTAKQSSDIKQGRDCFVATAPRYDGLEGVVLLVAFSTRL
ncbi:hypothetical protein [Rhodopseudomonas sp. BAL398]|uniref:hypothetical protein n=1 Tax=Rhodopseudomonas sp. BAL398 TaxID=3034676 RepID=UPI0023E12B18|nr:hypothetical protein [Rhodopseudomonas sp. BAL398]MDF3812965.1 hypothetical protein [Rhodopseudomonas sp. BAL398]